MYMYDFIPPGFQTGTDDQSCYYGERKMDVDGFMILSCCWAFGARG